METASPATLHKREVFSDVPNWAYQLHILVSSNLKIFESFNYSYIFGSSPPTNVLFHSTNGSFTFPAFYLKRRMERTCFYVVKSFLEINVACKSFHSLVFMHEGVYFVKNLFSNFSILHTRQGFSYIFFQYVFYFHLTKCATSKINSFIITFLSTNFQNQLNNLTLAILVG